MMINLRDVYVVLSRTNGSPALVPAGEYSESIPTFTERKAAQQWIDYLEDMWPEDQGEYYIKAMRLI